MSLKNLHPAIIIAAGLVAGAAWMCWADTKDPDAPASVWTPRIDIASFAVGISLWFTGVAWPIFVGGLIVGVHAAQVLWTTPKKQTL